jgi:hypothetical protein
MEHFTEIFAQNCKVFHWEMAWFLGNLFQVSKQDKFVGKSKLYLLWNAKGKMHSEWKHFKINLTIVRIPRRRFNELMNEIVIFILSNFTNFFLQWNSMQWF